MRGIRDVPPIAEVELSDVLAALADRSRRSVILELLMNPDSERPCSTFEFAKAKSTKTYHWKILRNAGLILQTDIGNGSNVRLRSDFNNRFPGLLMCIFEIERNS